MVKQPVAGRVKTRLAREIGVGLALRFYRQTIAAVSRRLARDSRWRVLLAVSPDSAVMSRHWPRYIPRLAQGRGDLGARLQRIMDRPFRGPILIIGSDIPAITPADIGAAFAALGSHDAVIGPSPDGGYWLIGSRRSPRVPRAFAGVPWSTAGALAATLSNLGHCRVALLRPLADVDDAIGFARASVYLGRTILPWPREMVTPGDAPSEDNRERS